MATYVKTRASISQKQGVEEQLSELFQYKFETLTDTHAYIKDLWTMTSNYLGTAIAVITELQTDRTRDSIRSLQLITAIGVTAGIVKYLETKTWPVVTPTGVAYFAGLILGTYALNQLITIISRRLKYRLKFPQNHPL